jgi:hypothetical protein
LQAALVYLGLQWLEGLLKEQPKLAQTHSYKLVEKLPQPLPLDQ